MSRTLFPFVEVRIRKFPGYTSGYETRVVYFKDALSKGVSLDRQASELKRDAMYAARFYKDFALGPRGDAQRATIFDGKKKIGAYHRTVSNPQRHKRKKRSRVCR